MYSSFEVKKGTAFENALVDALLEKKNDYAFKFMRRLNFSRTM